MRLFFGIKLSEEVSGSVIRAIEKQDFGRVPFRWVPPENFHFTLKFLGETDESKLPAIREAAGKAASGIKNEFSLTLNEFGAFPTLSSPRVIFYSVEQGGEILASLAADLDNEMSALGFRKEKRAYHPHLTLARIKKRPDPEIIEKLKGVPPLRTGNSQKVDSFQLIRSFLSRSGARYRKLADFDFSGS